MVSTPRSHQRPRHRTDGPKGTIPAGTVRVAWHHGRMTDQEARYDRIAEGYASRWAPVHRAATLELLDEIEPEVRTGARRLLDVGCGTGAMAAAAVARWPAVEIDGVDASAGMLAIAGRERAALPHEPAGRLRFHHGLADRLPFPDATFDVVTTAFVLQLVPSRHRALREARRVLRAGGRVALVTWLAGGGPFAADGAYDAALDAVGLEPREHGGHDDIVSPAGAVAILRRAGFSDARARSELLAHEFTPEGFLGFLARFDDEDRFGTLDTDVRARLERELLTRLRRLPPGGLRMELPIVYATGRRTT
jgi:SAM-dependent methyltransferase